MNIIVAVDQSWAIGYQGDLLVHIPEDMKYFKKMTIGHPVIMGRKTFESLPNKKPLKDRINIVLTKDENFYADDICICKNIEEVLDLSSIKEAFVIGGEQIYNLFLPYCEKAFVTKIYKNFTADKYFPNLDEMEGWEILDKSEIFTSGDGVGYQFFTYST